MILNTSLGPNSITFEVDSEDYIACIDVLGRMRDKTPIIIRNSINRTATWLNRQITREVKKRYAIDKQLLDLNEKEENKYGDGGKAKGKYINVEKAKVSNLVSTIKYKSPVFDLYDFKISNKNYYPASKGGPKLIYGAALKAPMKRLILKKYDKRRNAAAIANNRDRYKAFVIRYKNHSKDGTVSYHITAAQRVPGKRMKSDPSKEAVKSLLGPSLSKMVDGPKGALNAIGGTDKVQEYLANTVNKLAEQYFAQTKLR